MKEEREWNRKRGKGRCRGCERDSEGDEEGGRYEDIGVGFRNCTFCKSPSNRWDRQINT